MTMSCIRKRRTEHQLKFRLDRCCLNNHNVLQEEANRAPTKSRLEVLLSKEKGLLKECHEKARGKHCGDCGGSEDEASCVTPAPARVRVAGGGRTDVTDNCIHKNSVSSSLAHPA